MSTATAPGKATGGRAQPRWLHSRWLVPLVLALPFLVMIAALRGLTVTLPIFHSTDEGVYLYPTILQFSHELPFPDIGHYVAAQTPLFPLLEAYAGKLIGYELWRLRLVEVVISYALGLSVYVLLHRRLNLGRLRSLALAVLFVLSPYVFGTSFRAITDNLATLFIVLSVERFERYRESGELSAFCVGCAAVAAAILTRQSAAFMLAVAGLYALFAPNSLRRRSLALLAVALAAAPAAALFLSWHGLVPPGGDPSSCALCPAGRAHGATQGTLEVQTPELTLATIGLYGAILFVPLLAMSAWGRPRDELLKRVRNVRAIAAGVLLGALLLVAFPARPGHHAAGVLWNVSERLPIILGSSLLFWLLVPLAGAIVVWRFVAGPRPWLFTAFLVSFLLGALAIRFPWQKYVDPFALLALFFTLREDDFAKPRELAGAALLALAFIAYTLSFVV
jgi:4-amino-4-deoxy-L-arabinose transferase-like glycosyltransferase